MIIDAFLSSGGYSADEAEEPGTDSCRPEAWEHHAGWPPQTALQGEGHWLWLSESCFQGCLLYLLTVPLLQVTENIR